MQKRMGRTSPCGMLGPAGNEIANVLYGLALACAIATWISPSGKVPVVDVPLAVKYLQWPDM